MDIESFTKKVGFLTVMFLTTIGAIALVLGLALLFSSSAQAQEILQGKTPIAIATCKVDKNYVMGKDKILTRNCVLFGDESERGWVLIYDKNDKPAVVVEIDPEKGIEGQRIVWRKGDVTL